MPPLSLARVRFSLTHISVICWAVTFLFSQGLAQLPTLAPTPAPSLIPVTFTVSPLSVSYFGSVVVTANITQAPTTTASLTTSYTTTVGPGAITWPQSTPTDVTYAQPWSVTTPSFSVGNFTLSAPANASYWITNVAPINVTLIGFAINVTHSTATAIGDGNYSAVVFVTLASFPTSMPAATLTLTPNLGGANGAAHDLILTRGVGYLTFDQNTSLTQNFTIFGPSSTYQVSLTFTLGGSVGYAYVGPSLRTIDLAPYPIVSTSSLNVKGFFWGTWTYTFSISRLPLPGQTLVVNLTWTNQSTVISFTSTSGMTGSWSPTNYLLPCESAVLNFTISGSAASPFVVPTSLPTITSSANSFTVSQTQVSSDDQPLRWGVFTVTPSFAAQPGYNLTLDVALASTLPSNESVNFSATRLVWPGPAQNTITVNLTTTGVSFEFLTLNFTVSGIPATTWTAPSPFDIYFSYVNLTSISNRGINVSYVFDSVTWMLNISRPLPAGRQLCASVSWAKYNGTGFCISSPQSILSAALSPYEPGNSTLSIAFYGSMGFWYRIPPSVVAPWVNVLGNWINVYVNTTKGALVDPTLRYQYYTVTMTPRVAPRVGVVSVTTTALSAAGGMLLSPTLPIRWVSSSPRTQSLRVSLPKASPCTQLNLTFSASSQFPGMYYPDPTLLSLPFVPIEVANVTLTTARTGMVNSSGLSVGTWVRLNLSATRLPRLEWGEVQFTVWETTGVTAFDFRPSSRFNLTNSSNASWVMVEARALRNPGGAWSNASFSVNVSGPAAVHFDLLAPLVLRFRRTTRTPTLSLSTTIGSDSPTGSSTSTIETDTASFTAGTSSQSFATWSTSMSGTGPTISVSGTETADSRSSTASSSLLSSASSTRTRLTETVTLLTGSSSATSTIQSWTSSMSQTTPSARQVHLQCLTPTLLQVGSQLPCSIELQQAPL
jgi:hypothetical protein